MLVATLLGVNPEPVLEDVVLLMTVLKLLETPLGAELGGTVSLVGTHWVPDDTGILELLSEMIVVCSTDELNVAVSGGTGHIVLEEVNCWLLELESRLDVRVDCGDEVADEV